MIKLNYFGTDINGSETLVEGIKTFDSLPKTYQGLVSLYRDNKKIWTHDTNIVRPFLKDAIDDAVWLKGNL